MIVLIMVLFLGAVVVDYGSRVSRSGEGDLARLSILTGVISPALSSLYYENNNILTQEPYNSIYPQMMLIEKRGFVYAY